MSNEPLGHEECWRMSSGVIDVRRVSSGAITQLLVSAAGMRRVAFEPYELGGAAHRAIGFQCKSGCRSELMHQSARTSRRASFRSKTRASARAMLSLDVSPM